MRRVDTRNLIKGQTILVGEIGVGKFEVAEVERNRVEFKDWDKIDMDKGSIKKERVGEISHEGRRGSIFVLSKEEIKEVEKIKNKIKMLKELDK